MTSSSKQVFFDQRDYPFDNVRRVNPPRSLLSGYTLAISSSQQCMSWRPEAYNGWLVRKSVIYE